MAPNGAHRADEVGLERRHRQRERSEVGLAHGIDPGHAGSSSSGNSNVTRRTMMSVMRQLPTRTMASRPVRTGVAQCVTSRLRFSHGRVRGHRRSGPAQHRGSARCSAAARPGDIARAFGHISRPAVSRHLRVLREAGLVVADLQGHERHYRTDISGLTRCGRGSTRCGRCPGRCTSTPSTPRSTAPAETAHAHAGHRRPPSRSTSHDHPTPTRLAPRRTRPDPSARHPPVPNS